MKTLLRRWKSVVSLIVVGSFLMATALSYLRHETDAAPPSSFGAIEKMTSAASVEARDSDTDPAAESAVVPTTPGLNFFHTDGRKIVDAEGREVRITGISWFGLETDTLAPHGLWMRNYRDILDEVVRLSYNTIRLPFSNELFNENLKPRGVGKEEAESYRTLTCSRRSRLLTTSIREPGRRIDGKAVRVVRSCSL